MSDAESNEQVISEAKSTFDLSARLRGRPMRTKSVIVYTDEVAAERIQDLEVCLQGLTDLPTNVKSIASAARHLGMEEVADNLERIAASGVRDIEEFTRMEEEKAELVEQLKASALKIELQAIPEIILKDCRRQARKNLGIKGSGVPDERIEEFTDTVTAIALTKAVTSVRDPEGNVSTDLTVDGARDLQGYLPASEFGKIDQALADLGYRNVVAGAITDDPDF